MLKSLGHRDKQAEEQVAYNSIEPLTYHHIDVVDYWRFILDDIVTIAWRPYMSLGPWAKEGEKLPYTISQ